MRIVYTCEEARLSLLSPATITGITPPGDDSAQGDGFNERVLDSGTLQLIADDSRGRVVVRVGQSSRSVVVGGVPVPVCYVDEERDAYTIAVPGGRYWRIVLRNPPPKDAASFAHALTPYFDILNAHPQSTPAANQLVTVRRKGILLKHTPTAQGAVPKTLAGLFESRRRPSRLSRIDASAGGGSRRVTAPMDVVAGGVEEDGWWTGGRERADELASIQRHRRKLRPKQQHRRHDEDIILQTVDDDEFLSVLQDLKDKHASITRRFRVLQGDPDDDQTITLSDVAPDRPVCSGGDTRHRVVTVALVVAVAALARALM
ncbi:hypothetical protein PYCC9005_003478 [Savitreella phatthalungensis]